MSIKIGSMTIGYVQTNCYFVYDDEKKEAIVFDPAADGVGIYSYTLSITTYFVLFGALVISIFVNTLGVTVIE